MPKPAHQLLGQTFGKWLVIDRSEIRNTQRHWLCRCECGVERMVSAKNLLAGISTQCWDCHSCNYKHGMGTTNTYRIWGNMIARCENPNQRAYRYYGALGVRVCDRWRESFLNFLADMGEKPAGLSLDRINPFGNYEPGNCRWADAKTQATNKRRNYAAAQTTEAR